jgi:hypothetical protein
MYVIHYKRFNLTKVNTDRPWLFKSSLHPFSHWSDPGLLSLNSGLWPLPHGAV